MTLRAVGLLLLIGSVAGAAESAVDRDKRMSWWREARFGMFIHWGVYAVPAGEWKGKPVGGIGEWIMNSAKISVTEYAGLTKSFNPVKFDADAWVRLAKSAGQKYIVITAKHHDGFAMFPSKASPFNLRDATPFQRDPLAELAAACKKHGLKLGFYYSQAQDWHHPGGGAYGGHWDRAQDGNFDAYLDKIAVPQVRELLTQYGPVAVLWWDTPAEMTRTRAGMLEPLLALQPGIITNDRLGGGYAGDTGTPEQEIPARPSPGRDWETCMTMNDTWGFKTGDRNWKSADQLIRNLVDVASKGGNYLLNVGPTALGEIPPESVERLTSVGRWLAVNGTAVYGTTAGPFRALPWGRVTRKDKTLYLHVFDRPTGPLVLPRIRTAAKRAWALADPKKKSLAVKRQGEDLLVSLPAANTASPVEVLVLELGDEPVVDLAITTMPLADGTVELRAADAVIHGVSLRYEHGGGHDNLGYWVDPGEWVDWEVDLPAAGPWAILAEYACEKGAAGSQVQVEPGPALPVPLTVRETASWTTFRTAYLGVVELPAGRQRVAVRPRTMPGYAVMNLKSIRLVPSAR